jgi:hypothetical protein
VKGKGIIRFVEIGEIVDHHHLLLLNLYFSIYGFDYRCISFCLFSFDHLTIVRQSLVLHLVACYSIKY